MDHLYEFSPLLQLSSSDLLGELAQTHTDIANLIEQVGYLRAEEARGIVEGKPTRIQREASRDALIEKKFLIVRLLEHGAKES